MTCKPELAHGLVPAVAHTVARFLAVDVDPGLGPLIGALLAAVVAAATALFIAYNFTRKIKRTEVTTDCSKRFQEVLRYRQELNSAFYYDECGKLRSRVPTEQERFEGHNWYRQFFSLIESEFEFYRDGLVRHEKFLEWMKWRRHDFENSTPSEPSSPSTLHPSAIEAETALETNGVTYDEAWKWWSGRSPLNESKFRKFLDRVHDKSKGNLEYVVWSLPTREWITRWRVVAAAVYFAVRWGVRRCRSACERLQTDRGGSSRT